MSDQWIDHLKGLAKLEGNVGKKVAFETSAENIEQQARELQQLRDWRERVRTAFNVVDESVKMLPRDSYVAVDGDSLSRLGILIGFGVQ